MQKALRIYLQNQKHGVKKAHKEALATTKQEWQIYYRQQHQVQRLKNNYQKQERQSRREDWLLGPLAPNRNSSVDKGLYGTVDVESLQTPDVPQSIRDSPKVSGDEARDFENEDRHLKFEGRSIHGNVVEGDRVVVVHGPDRVRGAVGIVSSVDNAKEEVKIKNVNLADIRLPPSALPPPSADNPDSAAGQGRPKYETQELPLPISSVRLLHDYQPYDPHSHLPIGPPRAAIIRHVHASGPYLQRAIDTGVPSHTRYITGSETFSADGQPIAIPWPAEGRTPNIPQTVRGDTERQVVQVPTWEPTLDFPPLGYVAPTAKNVEKSVEPEAPYTLGLLPSSSSERAEATHFQRAGIHGFVSESKARARYERLSRGIADEIKAGRSGKPVKGVGYNMVTGDRNERVKRLLLEDARAIWWRDRGVYASPQAEALALNARRNREAREARLAQSNIDDLSPLVRGAAQNKSTNDARQKYRTDNRFTKEVLRLKERDGLDMNVQKGKWAVAV